MQPPKNQRHAVAQQTATCSIRARPCCGRCCRAPRAGAPGAPPLLQSTPENRVRPPVLRWSITDTATTTATAMAFATPALQWSFAGAASLRRRPWRAGHGVTTELRRCYNDDRDGPAMALQRSFAGATTTAATGRPWRCNGVSPAALELYHRRCNGASPGLQWSTTEASGCNGEPPGLWKL